MRAHHGRQVPALLVGAVILSALLSPQAASPQAHVKGSWTPKFDAQAIGIHAALVRIPGTQDSSRILYWGNTPGAGIGYRLWNPGTPSTSTVSVTSPGHNLFCAGHSFLDDGRLFVTGSTYVAKIGLDSCYIFTMGSPPSWTRTTLPMSYGRWYPTSTTLPTGQVLASSGNRYHYGLSFGGASPSGSRRHSRALALGHRPLWKDSLTIALPPLEDAATADSRGADLRFFVFGGRDDNGKLTNKVWRVEYVGSHPTNENAWKITELTASGSPPSPRRLHTAVFDYKTSDTTGEFWVYGGIDSNGTVLNDVHKFAFSGYPYAATAGTWSSAGTGPGARYGHTALFDSVGITHPGSMLIFGGRKQDGSLVDSEVHRFDFGTSQWSQLAMRNLVRPPARWLHAGTSEGIPFRRQEGAVQVSERRWLILGGRNAQGQTLDDDLWTLWLPQVSDSLPVWERVVPKPDLTYGRPAKRGRHAITYDSSPGRFVMFGGDTSGVALDSLSGGERDDIWTLDPNFPHNTDTAIAPDTARWTRLFADSTSPGPRAGHRLHYDARGVTARVPELHTVGAGTWESKHVKYLELYPFMFPTPRGTVFHAGPEDSTHEYSLSTGWASAIGSNKLRGGSAIAYGQGDSLILLKSGYHVDGPQNWDRTGIVGIPAGSSSPAWVEVASIEGEEMLSRANHNLTVLPNGKVLVTGGTVDGTPLQPQKAPQLWDPLNYRWSSALEEDPALRNYHSTAILLPDARVWSAGGDRESNLDRFTASIYSPPYLFRNGDTLAVRPVIQSCPDTVAWGHAISVVSPDVAKIRSACLIRAGAVTHAFNQDQRFLPLAIRDTVGTEVILAAPKDSLWAPPGDYLLFVVDSLGVPSKAKWVRVRGQRDDAPCGLIAPRAIANLADPDAGRNSVLLTWSAQGENGTCGTGHRFDVRRSNAAITDANFYGATRVTANVPPPGVAGAEHCLEVDGLSSCNTHHFAIKTRDAKGVWSKASNATSATTTCSGWSAVVCDGGGLLAGGGGEGGGSLRQTLELSRAGGESVTGADESGGENSILWASGSGYATDLRRVNGLTADGNGQYTIQLRQVGTWRTSVDQLALGFVDHAVSEVAIAGPDLILVGSLGAVANVVDIGESNVTGLTGTDVQPRELRAGELLTVNLNGPTANTALVVESAWRAARDGENLAGILVQTPQPEGGWTTVGEIQPRRQFDRSAVVVGQSASVRLVFPRTCTVRSLAQLEVDRRVLPEPLDLLSATVPGAGAVTGAVGEAGGDATNVAPGDSLTVTYAAPQGAAEGARELFLVARGSMEPIHSQGATESAGLASGVREPYVYSLGQARPNPSSGEVTIDFSLAQRSPVSFRIYDVAGRLVRSLVNEELAEGPQSVLWDGRTDAGQRVGAGWHSERKLIVLQR
jgi:hypothetical protein